MTMRKYIGTKLIQAKQMTRAAYNAYRGWTLPVDEDGNDKGYLVEYLDGGKPNHPDHHGYISWSPQEQFENAYNAIHDKISFEHALVALKAGDRVARAGWNGKGMWLILVHGAGADSDAIDYVVRDDTDTQQTDGLKLLPWFGMKTADSGFVPWLASQTDMLANDWVVLKSESTEMAQVEPIAVPYHAELRDVVITTPIDPLKHDIFLTGHIFGDAHKRFNDGTWVTTSKVVEWSEAESIATTMSGNRYKVVLAGVTTDG